MRLFSKLYTKVMDLAAHRHAARYLAGLSFAESSFFPVPPDVMLAPMSLAAPRRAWFYAALTTVASVLGGIAGYALGLLAFDAIEPLLHRTGYWDDYLRAKEWFDTWGFWAVLLAGFSPIPYKVFTIAAGVVVLSFPLFVVASLLGRGARFFLVAGVVVLGGEKMERTLRAYAETLGWILVALAVILYLILRG
ncbi:MAG: YqaA family protein [Acidiferrobacterales bacterium]